MFDPVDFYDLANNLVSNNADESMHRCSVGRHYYACFLLARKLLEERRGYYPSNRTSVHADVQQQLIAYNIRGLADQLSKLFRQRKIADYELDNTVGKNESANASTIAKNLMHKLPKQI